MSKPTEFFRHRAHAPVGGVGGTLLHGLLDDPELEGGAERLSAGRLGTAFDQAFDASLDKVLLPTPDVVFETPTALDLLTLAASQTFPCLELAWRECVGDQFKGRTDRKGKARPPPMLAELLQAARTQRLISPGAEGLHLLRNSFQHGSDAILNPPLFLGLFEAVTSMNRELFRTET